MNFNAKMLMAAVMMVGSVAATGCNKASDSSPVAPEESVDSAPTDESNAATNSVGFERDERRVHYYAPYGPPAARFEVRTRAPSERHFWVPGYYRWNGREHVWYGGRWYLRRDSYNYVAPHWQQNRFGRWEYVPGYWRRY